jgi:sulfatase modifying factor 1
MEVSPDDERHGDDEARRAVSGRLRSGLLVALLCAPNAIACRESKAELEPAPSPKAPAAVLAPASAAPEVAAPIPVASAAPAPAPAPVSSSICGEGMVLVEGNFCTEVEHECARWLDDPKLPFARCADYSSAKCVGERRPMRFCIDQREFTAPGETLPQNFASYQIASQTCKSAGKRLCTETEWTFACEGETMRPYPYGFSREPVCNYDRSDLYEMKKGKQVLKDLRIPSGSLPGCVSPFGVFDMAGNLDEPTRREQGTSERFHNALKGGWWMAARNRCRPATTAHDDYYKDIQIGIRCCADAPALDPEPAR